ncbi:hypothetical protein ACH4UY_00690 [Streptomyces longwoodensis]|uniref:hypothetical protein n=1 Tax=Streptomyces longwoodensis TaxID=68231 RepID=UPI00379FB2E2
MKLGKALATGVAEEQPQTADTDTDSGTDIRCATDTDLPAETGDRSAADGVPAVR